jgi:hypothetical protein
MPPMLHPLQTKLPPQLVSVLPHTEGPYYLGRTPPWRWKLLMAGMLTLVLGVLGFATVQAWHGRASWAEGMIATFCLPFLLLLLRPVTWQSPIALVADRTGLHFLHGKHSSERSFLPWQHTGAMQIERHGNRKRITLLVRDESPFWDAARQSRLAMLLLPPVDRAGYRKLQLLQVVGNLQRAMATLEHLRNSQPTILASRRDSRPLEFV